MSKGRFTKYDFSSCMRHAYYQGGRTLGDETSVPRFVQCLIRSRTGTSAFSPSPVRILDGKSCFLTNRKWFFLFVFTGRGFHLICRQHLIFNLKQIKLKAENIAYIAFIFVRTQFNRC